MATVPASYPPPAEHHRPGAKRAPTAFRLCKQEIHIRSDVLMGSDCSGWGT